MSRVEELRRQLHAAEERVRVAETAASDRNSDEAALDEVTGTLRQANDSRAAKKDELAKRAELVENFPTETQLLKLERRLETLKTQLQEAQRSANQLRTGIDAYTVRCEACSTARGELAATLQEASAAVFEAIAAKADEEARLHPSEAILDTISELIAICEEREGQVADLNQMYARRLEEDATLSERIVRLQRKIEGDIPKIEEDADRYIAGLTAAWVEEREALQRVYDRFYSVNKEQQHHLVRGTHVKRDLPPNSGHEAALSARQSNLSAQLIDARARYQETDAENKFIKKITDQLRSEGRLSLSVFDSQQSEVASRLKAAREERIAAEEEARNFRNLKSDLQHALQTIRETPSGIARIQ
jgi:chromosome segregation ATPase